MSKGLRMETTEIDRYGNGPSDFHLLVSVPLGFAVPLIKRLSISLLS